MKSVLLALLFSFSVAATEVVQWENIPLPVTLHVGQERIVDVGKTVRIGYPATLEGKVRLQSAGGKVFLLANTAFPPTRIQLRDTSSGELILLDIQATQSTSPLEAMQISYAPQTPATAKTPVPVTASTEPLPVLLVRYAAQNLYAPLRTVEGLPGVTPAPVRLAKRTTTLLPQQSVTATPLASWQVNATTAIRLQNQSGQRITLDPRELQGQFTAAAFQHDWLGPRGLAEDTTVVYLVTEGPVSRALLTEPKP